MPAASLRIMPARSISWWLTVSASAGVSRTVASRNFEVRMYCYLACGKNRASIPARARGRPAAPELLLFRIWPALATVGGWRMIQEHRNGLRGADADDQRGL